jgi:putative membrane protein
MWWWYGGTTPASGMFPSAGFWAWHMILMVLFWSGVVALVVMAARHISPWERSAGKSEFPEAGILSAVTILQERYARGEIGREEFMQKQRDLAGGPSGDEAAA